ncbi:hypothetical protein J6590_058464 [Homalodisca vitripennis]|nr:hypothetical protein J6590_058464 [Homalodisca vitripennis]
MAKVDPTAFTGSPPCATRADFMIQSQYNRLNDIRYAHGFIYRKMKERIGGVEGHHQILLLTYQSDLQEISEKKEDIAEDPVSFLKGTWTVHMSKHTLDPSCRVCPTLP